MKELKNAVLLSKDNGMDLIARCRSVLDSFQLKQIGSTREFRILKMRYVVVNHFETPPHWYGYQNALHQHLNLLEKMLSRPDPIFISLDQYQNLILLSEGDFRANPIFILNY